MEWDRDKARQLMRESISSAEAARVAENFELREIQVALARAAYELERISCRNPDPITTATFALVTGDCEDARRLYHEAIKQNQSNPDERSYEWCIPLLLRLHPDYSEPTVRAQLEDCEAQALRAGDEDAVSRVQALLSSGAV